VAVERVPLTADVQGLVEEWLAAPGERVRSGEPVIAIASREAAEAPSVPAGPEAAAAEPAASVPNAPAADTAAPAPREAPAGEGGDTAATAAGPTEAEAPGDVRTILTSPCDCTVVARDVAAGERIAAGDTVATLTPFEAGAHVEALFPGAAAPRPGDAVAVDLPASGERFAGIVEAVGPPGGTGGLALSSSVAGPDGTVLARIRTTPAVSPSLAGAPAVVTLAPDA
jgi:biotin carboxyl carrier protein